MDRVRICSKDEVEAKGVDRGLLCEVVHEVDGTEAKLEIVVFKIGEVFHGFERRCPHQNADLATFGIVQGSEFQCEAHEALFNPETGECLKKPRRRPMKREYLQTYPITLEGEELYVDFKAFGK